MKVADGFVENEEKNIEIKEVDEMRLGRTETDLQLVTL